MYMYIGILSGNNQCSKVRCVYDSKCCYASWRYFRQGEKHDLPDIYKQHKIHMFYIDILNYVTIYMYDYIVGAMADAAVHTSRY